MQRAALRNVQRTTGSGRCCLPASAPAAALERLGTVSIVSPEGTDDGVPRGGATVSTLLSSVSLCRSAGSIS